MSRTTNSFRNAGTAMGSQLMTNLLQFVCKTVFIYTLGKEYLGISSLYTNVLTILSITELGFSTVITYSLYLPLTKGDRAEIRSLMAFFKRVYRVVGLVVLVLGLALMPFLPRLMTGVTDKVDIYQYYLLYLIQSVVSYLFFAYKSVILIADQKKYVTDLVAVACKVCVCLLQILVLLVWKSFLAYTVLGILTSVAQNIVTGFLVDRRYPYLREKAEPLSGERRRELYKQVYATFLQKISTAVGTATDNLIISACVNITAVGLYSNYSIIVNAVQSVLGSLFRGMTASVGNLYVTETKERSAFVFRALNLANSYLVCVCSVCFLVLFQPFVTLWVGTDYLLDDWTVVVIVLNFATNYLQTVVLSYRDATGLFVVGKYRSVVNAAMNLGISLVLVRPFGMTGVFLGSIISRLATNWWFDAWVLHRRGFGVSPAGYYVACGVCLTVAAMSAWVTEYMFRAAGAGWLTLIGRGLCGVAVATLAYGILYGRSREMAYLVQRIKKFRK